MTGRQDEAYLLGLRLRGKRVVVVGGGAVAARRVPRLLAAGAEVLLVSPRATPALEELAAASRIDWRGREYREGDCADATAKEADAAGALVCDVPVNRGQGAALRLGYRIAREGGAQYIVTTDADGQYNPLEIESLLAPVVAGTADFVTGSRRMGSEETKDPIRRAGVRFFASLVSMLTGQRITDTTFGLRAMRAEVTGAVQLEQPQYQASELLIGVITHGYRVLEVPATIHRRRVGESKKGQNPFYGLHLPMVNNVFYGLRFTRVVLGTWWRERRRRR